MSEPTYTDLRLTNLRKHMGECEEIALSLLENASTSYDFTLLLANVRGMIQQIDAFRKTHRGEQP